MTEPFNVDQVSYDRAVYYALRAPLYFDAFPRYDRPARWWRILHPFKSRRLEREFWAQQVLADPVTFTIIDNRGGG